MFVRSRVPSQRKRVYRRLGLWHIWRMREGGSVGRLDGWTDGWYISRACLNMDHSPSDSSMTSWVSLCKETTKCFTYPMQSNKLNLKNSIVLYTLPLRH